MTIQEFLQVATSALQQAGVPTARLDALVLLEDAMGHDRAWILAHQETKISELTEVKLNTKIAQRAKHIPLAYIRSKAEFYGREFIVNEHVLVPRPETETMIDLLKKELGPPDDDQVIVDVGTGSGAIAITAKLELPQAKVIATDIDARALQIARKNTKRLAADIKLLQGDLLTTIRLSDNPTILLANLPYVPERYSINQAAEHEPKHAIFGGKDGLNLYRRLWEQITGLPKQPLLVLTESLPTQHADMIVLAQRAGFAPHSSQDFIQVFKPAN